MLLPRILKDKKGWVRATCPVVRSYRQLTKTPMSFLINLNTCVEGADRGTAGRDVYIWKFSFSLILTDLIKNNFMYVSHLFSYPS